MSGWLVGVADAIDTTPIVPSDRMAVAAARTIQDRRMACSFQDEAGGGQVRSPRRPPPRRARGDTLRRGHLGRKTPLFFELCRAGTSSLLGRASRTPNGLCGRQAM